MTSVNLGERLGTLRRDSRPLQGKDSDSYSRFTTAKLVQDLVIEAAFEGAGLEQIKLTEKGEGSERQIGLYASPPVEDPAEAHRLSGAIANLLEKARTEYPGGGLSPNEMDTFIPVPEPQA